MVTVKKLLKKRASRKTLVKKLDKLVSEIVVVRDKKCVTCGSLTTPGCGHIFSRGAYSTRWDLDNCHRQCWPCNFRHVRDQFPYIEWYRKNYGTSALNKLRRKFETHKPIKDYELEELYEKLKVI